LQVKKGRVMPPTGEVEVYPLGGEFGWVQMLLVVGTGTHEVLVVELVVLLLLADVTEQV
jgi:hypothetical protein